MEPNFSQFPILNAQLLQISEKLTRIASEHIDKRLALKEAVAVVRQALGFGVFTIVLTDGNEIEHVACAGCSEGFFQHMQGRRISLWQQDGDFPLDGDLFRKGQIIEKYNIHLDGQGVANPEVAQKYGLHALVAFPLNSEKGLIGYLNYFQDSNDPFSAQMKSLLDMIARHISITIERLESFANRRRLQRLSEVMQAMAEAQDVKALLTQMLNSGAELVNAPCASISQLNLSNGELTIGQSIGPDLQVRTLHSGQGITNEALKTRQYILVHDVTRPEWKDRYVPGWPDTRSELAVPIGLQNAAVRVGPAIERAPKSIGVLNVESPQVKAFSDEDASLLSFLANYGAVLIEGLDTDSKLERLAETQRTILDVADWDGTIKIMLKAIQETLGYELVNISLVVPDTDRIKSEYVVGIPQGMEEEFKRMADHPLKGEGRLDIQADICRTRQIEVPPPDDPRFDRDIYDRFGHSQMIRVYLPLIFPSDNRVMGTVEAGYRRTEHRTHIYEQDVQILRSFIDYAARALARRQNMVLERIGHEFRNPVVGIRNIASFLQRRYSALEPQRIERKCDDILIDCEILLSQIAQLEHYLGKPLPPPNVEKTLVFRDVIIMTIQQFQSYVKGQGFNFDDVTYEAADIYKISPIWVDKSRLGQVFSNLLINSIKYAENDPSTFSIHIKVEENREAWRIKIQDMGIGVEPEYAEDIFRQGFRTPEALGRNVTGSGLGLTIARQYMRSMEGDLQLTNYSKPTEFTVILPKSLAKKEKEVRDDSSRG